MKQTGKQSIITGCYGWRHKHWSGGFYPEDLPAGKPEDDLEDWRLTYYSNEFNAVLVPADYWYTAEPSDCESWLEAVDDEFRFFVECHINMLRYISISELADNMKKLQPQLAALVFFGDKQPGSCNGLQSEAKLKIKQFYPLLDTLALDVYASGSFIDAVEGFQVKSIFRPDIIQPGQPIVRPELSGFAFIENDLSDLRLARVMVEAFVDQLANEKESLKKCNGKSTIIVGHPQLRAANLSKFRSLLEIMGF